MLMSCAASGLGCGRALRVTCAAQRAKHSGRRTTTGHSKMELMCAEQSDFMVQRAFCDPTLMNARVLQRLLKREDRHLPSASTYTCVQSEVQPYMRKIVAGWMLEVCDEQRCEEEVFPVSVNLLDRFLSYVDIKRCQLQLLGAVCMFISSKLKETIPLTAEKLVIYTDNSITMEELLHWETLVLTCLRWDVSVVTPNDFLDDLLQRLSLHASQAKLLRRHAQTFLAICATDFPFANHPPSLMASASICVAISGMLGAQWLVNNDIHRLIHSITHVDVDCLKSCQEQIEQLLASNINNIHGGAQSASAAEDQQMPQTAQAHKQQENGSQPSTPTDVRDVVC